MGMKKQVCVIALAMAAIAGCSRSNSSAETSPVSASVLPHQGEYECKSLAYQPTGSVTFNESGEYSGSLVLSGSDQPQSISGRYQFDEGTSKIEWLEGAIQEHYYESLFLTSQDDSGKQAASIILEPLTDDPTENRVCKAELE